MSDARPKALSALPIFHCQHCRQMRDDQAIDVQKFFWI
jgi:hypothetical protein